ncbi:hypothetical protein ABZ883_04520 [Streptomyces sp. NPDC046977]|uniref:hypothetical protein n=1 Tax=Streptomyces sp. NPDC046977 TaxID=3154703 RepID=UPI0033E4BD19
MPDTTTPRRTALLEEIRRTGGNWGRVRAATYSASLGYGGSRDTARQDLRALVRRGDLVQIEARGRHAYTVAPPADGGES